MAFLPDAIDPNAQGATPPAGQQIQQVPQIPTLQGASGPTASSGTGTQTGTTNTAFGGPGAAPSQPWQNISTYLDANAGQAGNVAGKIAGDLTSQYNTANQAITDETPAFTGQVQAGTTATNQSLLDSAAKDPTTFAKDPNNVQAFQNQLNAKYTGPTDFSHSADYTALQGQVLKGQQNAGLANQGTAGINTLLQNSEGNQSQGASALDSLLLQENPTNFSTIQSAATPFAGLTSYLNQTQTGLDAAAQKGATDTAATAQNAQGQFNGPGGVVPTFQNQLNSTVQANQSKSQAFNTESSDIIARLGSGQPLTQQEQFDVDPTGGLSAVNPFGTSTGVYQNMLANGLPGGSPGILGQYYTPADQTAPASLANSATVDQRAEANALNQLMGSSQFQIPSSNTQFYLPQSPGSYNDKAMFQGLFDQLNNNKSVMPQLTPEQQNSYLTDIQTLGGYLGMPTVPNPGAPPPADNPTPTGPPYLAPPTDPFAAPVSQTGLDGSHFTRGI
jgi:hypothetical protein